MGDIDGAARTIHFHEGCETREPWSPHELQPERRTFSKNRPASMSLHCADIEKAKPKKDYMWRRLVKGRRDGDDSMPNCRMVKMNLCPQFGFSLGFFSVSDSAVDMGLSVRLECGLVPTPGVK